MEKLLVCRGLEMPFYPMRPWKGRPLTLAEIGTVYKDSQEETTWIVQPKLNGDRACLAVFQDHVYIQNRHGGWFRHRVANAPDFLKLPSGTVLDGEVFESRFHAFEALAYDGKSFAMNTAAERSLLAMHLTRLLGHDWLFEKPSRRWLQDLKKNAPRYEGVVLKKAASPYRVLASASVTSRDWQKCLWV